MQAMSLVQQPPLLKACYSFMNDIFSGLQAESKIPQLLGWQIVWWNCRESFINNPGDPPIHPPLSINLASWENQTSRKLLPGKGMGGEHIPLQCEWHTFSGVDNANWRESEGREVWNLLSRNVIHWIQLSQKWDHISKRMHRPTTNVPACCML